MYSVFDDKGYMSLKFKTLREVEKCAEDWRDEYIGEGVDCDSYISIVKWIDDEDFEIIKRWNITVDEERYDEIGHPKQHGFDFEFWAKWTEPYMSEQYNELWRIEKDSRYGIAKKLIEHINTLGGN